MKQKLQHWVILTNLLSDKPSFLKDLEKENFPKDLHFLKGLNGNIFSKKRIEYFIKEEENHDIEVLHKEHHQALKELSSGEQKIALLKHVSKEKQDYLIIDNLFDSIDHKNYKHLVETISEIAKNTFIVQITSRKNDVLPFITHFTKLEGAKLQVIKNYSVENNNTTRFFKGSLPTPIHERNQKFKKLVQLTNVSVAYWDRKILHNINWEIKSSEFWQLSGENGSGKSTLISLITGDNHKAYGQNLVLFDRLRGTGETIWDIKSKIGYFTPAMLFNFKGYHTVLHMLISGIRDSIGLYKKPSEVEILKAMEWLKLLQMEPLKNTYFKNLNKGQQRLIMLARAFIKWPYLLILDEPTVDLDDENALLFTKLLNKFHRETDTAIIYVSHRKEIGIIPNKCITLTKTNHGSIVSF